ncbi:MAG TPA: gamma-glutamyl-gamma-aminobutyrate hydrolase family protein [Candidatus Dormibacteraeota bacterium]|jgi:putative glutamine amidotransferase|nr:gamma-glutamyl-gamma-aminobutyrate hydrolase family protein [Candidatus Dormibacteraeota bacterium]
MTELGRVRVGISAGAETPVERYVAAVADVGAEPVVLRPGKGAPDGIDALLLPGGRDIEPWRFGAAVIDELAAMVKLEPERDRWEWQLLDLASGRELPVLGVCRGFQVLNAYEGGTLYQHLPAAGFDSIDHQPGGRRDLVAHDVTVAEGRLSRLMGDERGVNSIHHQGVHKVARTLVATVRSEDGLVEGVESPDGRLLGVQWHPESMTGSAASRALFLDLVERAGRRG